MRTDSTSFTNFSDKFDSPIAGRLGQIGLLAVLFATLGLMLIPLTPSLVDAMLIGNLVASLTLLVLGVSISNPLVLFSFPSLILVTTLLRLGLNISSTRLILSTGEAGQIIHSFGNIVTGGNLFIGVVIFAVLLVVQFLVVAKGSERVAEVAARFTLDALPGKQMSIDADLRAGLISNSEAKKKRAELITESKFYGAMDGAMKFIKGESVAVLAITAINVIGGFLVGMISHDLPFRDALNIYTTLTIGESLSAQLPAFLVTVAAGLLVTRVHVSGEEHSLGEEIGRQIFNEPKPFYAVAVISAVLAFFPGFPKVLFFSVTIALTALGVFIQKQREATERQQNSLHHIKVSDKDGLERLGRTYPLLLELSPILYARFLTDSRWQDCFNHLYPKLRLHLSRKTGVPFPELKIETNEALPPHRYVIKIFEIPVEQGFLAPEHGLIRNPNHEAHALLIDHGKSAKTIHGTPVLLFEMNRENILRSRGMNLSAPEEILLRHLAMALKKHAKEFIGIQEVRNSLSHLEEDHAELVREVVPRLISVNKLAEVIKRLVDENIPVNDFRLILETLSICQPDVKDPVALTEEVRIGLKRVINHIHSRGGAKLPAFLLDPELEKEIIDGIRRSGSECYLALDPARLRAISAAAVKFFADHDLKARDAVILTTIEIRRFVRKIIESDLIETAVLSYQELEANLIIDTRDTISLNNKKEPHDPLPTSGHFPANHNQFTKRHFG